MQVEHSVAKGGAPRGVSRLGSVPILAIPQANPGDAARSLWSDADQKRIDKRDRLRDDEDRVQEVVNGMGPSVTERIQQARSERADAHAGAERRTFARDLAQEQAALRNNSSGQPGNRSADGQSNPVATPDDSATSQSKPGTAATSTMCADSDALDVPAEAPTTPATPKPTPGNSEPQQPDKNPRAPQPPMPASNNQALNMHLRGGATPPTQPNPAITPQMSGESAGNPSQSPAPASAISSAHSKNDAPTPIDPANADRFATLRTTRRPASNDQAQSQSDETETDQRAENVQRMLRVLRGSLLRDKSSTVIRLDPPELGSLRLEMNLRKEAMDLRVGAESDAAREMLKDELETLRNGLQAAGIRLERVEVYSLAVPPPVEQHDSRTLERQGGGEPRDTAPRRTTPREATQRASAAAESEWSPEPEWTPGRPQRPAVSQGRVNVVV